MVETKTRFKVGQRIAFTSRIDGVYTINQGDWAIYLGSNQARIMVGPSAGWLVTLCIDAPVKAQGH